MHAADAASSTRQANSTPASALEKAKLGLVVVARVRRVGVEPRGRRSGRVDQDGPLGGAAVVALVALAHAVRWRPRTRSARTCRLGAVRGIVSSARPSDRRPCAARAPAAPQAAGAARANTGSPRPRRAGGRVDGGVADREPVARPGGPRRVRELLDPQIRPARGISRRERERGHQHQHPHGGTLCAAAATRNFERPFLDNPSSSAVSLRKHEPTPCGTPQLSRP